jgi:hypothetical protein
MVSIIKEYIKILNLQRILKNHRGNTSNLFNSRNAPQENNLIYDKKVYVETPILNPAIFKLTKAHLIIKN